MDCYVSYCVRHNAYIISPLPLSFPSPHTPHPTTYTHLSSRPAAHPAAASCARWRQAQHSTSCTSSSEANSLIYLIREWVYVCVYILYNMFYYTHARTAAPLTYLRQSIRWQASFGDDDDDGGAAAASEAYLFGFVFW